MLIPDPKDEPNARWMELLMYLFISLVILGVVFL